MSGVTKLLKAEEFAYVSGGGGYSASACIGVNVFVASAQVCYTTKTYPTIGSMVSAAANWFDRTFIYAGMC